MMHTVFPRPPRTREKLDAIEPTLTLSSLLCLVLFPCSLQTCSVFPFYDVGRWKYIGHRSDGQRHNMRNLCSPSSPTDVVPARSRNRARPQLYGLASRVSNRVPRPVGVVRLSICQPTNTLHNQFQPLLTYSSERYYLGRINCSY
jgi:hypothetical protein